LLFYGMHEFGMSRADVLATRYGEMIDLINCLAVYTGAAKIKEPPPSFDEIMTWR